MTTVTTVTQADKITMAWVLKNLDLDAIKDNYQPQPKSNRKSRHDFTMPPLGTWRRDPYGEISVLVEVAVDECQPSEGDWEWALKQPETRLYIEWQKAGHEPPPLSLIRTASGSLRVQNRRRWLAAREAGVKTLRCWYSPTHPEHCTSPKWSIK